MVYNGIFVLFIIYLPSSEILEKIGLDWLIEIN